MTNSRDFFRAEFFDELLADFVLDGVDRGFAGEFAGREQRGNEAVAGELLGFVQNFVGNDVERDFAFLLAELSRRVPFARAIIGWMASCANFSAALKSASVISLAAPSYMTMSVVVADIDEVQIAFRPFRRASGWR